MTNILIVHDEPYMEIWADHLNKLGYNTLLANSSGEGMEKLAQKPDVILLDYSIQEMNGSEFSRKVRENPLYRKISIIGIGSFPEGYSRAYLTEMLPNPFNIEQLLACIKKYEK